MKYVKTYENFLNELDYGSQLFGDVKGSTFDVTKAYARYLKLIKGKQEENTPEEEDIFNAIVGYIRNADYDKKIGEKLKELLPLKEKFPLLLDPLSDPFVEDYGVLWRGATMETSELVSILEKNSVDWSKENKDWYITANANSTINSRSERGALSFTFNKSIASDFVRSESKTKMSIAELESRYPIIIQAKISAIKDKLILAPSFLEAVGEWFEVETLYLDSKIPCDKIIVPPPSFFGKLRSVLMKGESGINSLPTNLQKFIKVTNYL